MIESWWAAHALEFAFWGSVVAPLSVFWFFETLATAWRERKQKRKDGLL